MGIEHYVACGQCKEYIDIHKAYNFAALFRSEAPYPTEPQYPPEFGHDDFKGYWAARGVWFLAHHRGHSGVELWTDTQDEWFDLEPTLKEVFRHEDEPHWKKK